MMYKIVFIDEEITQQREFKRAFRNLRDKIFIEAIFPLANLDEMIESVLDRHPDALVTDWNLNEIKTDLPSPYEVSYNGSELVTELLNIKEGFPCFIISSFDRLASTSESTQDVNLLYSKDCNKSENYNDPLSFQNKIILQVEKYTKRIDDIKEELVDLQKLHHERALTSQEEDRLIYLDTLLEHAFDKKSSIPKDLKKISNSEQLCVLINSVNELLGIIKDEE